MPIPRIMRREKSFPHIKEIPEKIVIRHSNQSRKQPHEYAHEIQTGINQLQFPYLPFAQIAPLLPLVFPFLQFHIRNKQMEKRRVYLNNGFNSSGISISFAFSASKHSRPLSDKVKCICRLSLSPKLRTINSFSSMERMTLEVCEADRPVFPISHWLSAYLRQCNKVPLPHSMTLHIVPSSGFQVQREP